MAKEVQLAVRMTTEERAVLEKAADATGRTLSGYMLWATKDTLKREGFEADAPKRAGKKGK